MTDTLTTQYGQEVELPQIPDDTRVAIVAGDLAGDLGHVSSWYWSFGSLVYMVLLDNGDTVPVLPSQLQVAG